MPTILNDEAELDPALLAAEFADVLQMTREVFGGDARIETYPDPEIVCLNLINFCATTTGTPRELSNLSEVWHDKLETLRPVYDRRLGLCLEPAE